MILSVSRKYLVDPLPSLCYLPYILLKPLTPPVICHILLKPLDARFRRLAESGEQVPGIVFNTFKSRYQEPQLQTEGFSDVVKVNFVPDFGNSSALRELYGMFLGG